MDNLYLGIDVGSVSTNLVLLTEEGEVLQKLYLRTQGQPIRTVQQGLIALHDSMPPGTVVKGVGSTGSGRQLAEVIVGADVVKNEITAHAVAALHYYPEARTIFEIGGQDSKLILLRDGIVMDFAMNTVCAAGTGSFLDRQASRLNIPIEEFGGLALKSSAPVRIAGRCAVFAESDMIHKQQLGHNTEDIIRGLCEAMVRNYLNNLGKGKEIKPPIIFQGGVAANIGIKAAFEEALKTEIVVPQHYDVMGAVGAAFLAREAVKSNANTNFLGFDRLKANFSTRGFECSDCPNMCEVVEIYADGAVTARWGDRCGKWNAKGRYTVDKLA